MHLSHQSCKKKEVKSRYTSSSVYPDKFELEWPEKIADWNRDPSNVSITICNCSVNGDWSMIKIVFKDCFDIVKNILIN